ncbi:Nn.00g090990.m01.CDS01 [Neocucurbitaria sp. VM-36]
MPNSDIRTAPIERVDQSPDSGLLAGLATHATTLEAREYSEFSRLNAPRPRYVFTPYEQARLRKITPEVAAGLNSSFYSSIGSGSGSVAHPTTATHVSFLQMLLPSLDHIWKLVDYHEVYLLWYHCCYHGPTLRSELENVIAEQEDKTTLDVTGLHLQWLGLLFSIMAGSLTCTSDRLLREWGFSKSEAVKLSLQWYKATITSLNHGEWTSDHNIYSVQAITTLTMSAHSLGRSTELSVLLGAALKIAQGLGLDKLDHDVALEQIDKSSSADQRHLVLKRELGRKLWSQLCVQDWMSLPFAGNHNINPAHFTTTRPSSRDHLTMEPLPATFPTYISYGNYLFEIAKLVVRHHEAMLQSTTPFTKYQHVLDYDTQMRDLATKGIPRYFHVMEPIDALWPEWVHWARSSLTVCFAHKIIMIHRAYIRQSFTNPVYSMTRITCTAAAKTILNEAKQAKYVTSPIIWIDKAFCVAAAIILCLDIFHRPESDPELEIHKNLVLECIEQLRKFDNSVIAVRGVNLLTEILNERDRATVGLGWPPQNINIAAIAQSISTLDESRVIPGIETKSSADLFPPQVGFSNHFLFRDLFS